jgi:hypothetical protein
MRARIATMLEKHRFDSGWDRDCLDTLEDYNALRDELSDLIGRPRDSE